MGNLVCVTQSWEWDGWDLGGLRVWEAGLAGSGQLGLGGGVVCPQLGDFKGAKSQPIRVSG